jgi:hypothetical protein
VSPIAEPRVSKKRKKSCPLPAVESGSYHCTGYAVVASMLFKIHIQVFLTFHNSYYKSITQSCRLTGLIGGLKLRHRDVKDISHQSKLLFICYQVLLRHVSAHLQETIIRLTR